MTTDAAFWHRLQFAFTVTYHYLFPQLTMGMVGFLVYWTWRGQRPGGDAAAVAARFWTRVFGLTFALGVVTGIPMEFQFGTNWSRFSKAAGGVIGQTLAMEGVFSFFLESSFLGVFLFGEKRLGPKAHWFAAFLVFLGSWLSGFFIIATDAWMQHPVGYELGPKGEIVLTSIWALLTNPWAFWQYCHNMTAAVMTGSGVMASIGAYYYLQGKHVEYGKTFIRVGVIAGATACAVLIFPTGDGQGKMLAQHQPITLAAMEGLFDTEQGAPLVILGQPDMEKMKLDNPLTIPNMLSILTYQRWEAEIKGLRSFPRDQWPDNIPLLYYSYHIMVGLGTIMVSLFGLSLLLLYKERLYKYPLFLWGLMLALPFPYIATTAGWITAEVGRQPWLIYGLMRTADGTSPYVSTGSALFTLIGFMGMYLLLGILFLFMVHREIEHGPAARV